MWKKKICNLTLCLLLLLTGCQKKPKVTMDSLKLDFQEGDLPSLHPHALVLHLRGLAIAKNLFECLTRINAEGQAELAGAKSVDISPDGLLYTFTLRLNKWSDGTPVTAHQYENAWKEALSPTSDCARAALLYVIKNAEEAKKGEVPLERIGVKAIDAQTLQVELAYPSPYLLELLARPICAPLVDPKKKEPSEFNGPFLVDTWKREDLLRLKPNPHFWNSSQVLLKQIDIFMIQDTLSTFALFEKGEINWIGAPFCPLSVEQIGHLRKNNTLRSHPIDRTFWIFLNTQHPSLASPLIRQALSLAVDRSAITKHILIGGKPLGKPLPISLFGENTSSAVGMNLEEAQKRFEQGLNALGYTKATLPPITITYSQQANRKQLATYLQEVWSKTFGIDVRLQAQEWNVLRSNLGKGLFEVTGCFEVALYKDPMEFLERFVSINPCNFAQWTFPTYGETVTSAKKERDPQRRLELLGKAEQILTEQVPFIPISTDVLLFEHHPHLKGYVLDCIGAVDFSYASFSP